MTTPGTPGEPSPAATGPTPRRGSVIALPAGHTLVTYRERPDLDDAIRAHTEGIWAPFMLEDLVANGGFETAYERWPEFQQMVMDPSGAIVALGNAMPLSWDGTDPGLPDGWDEQVLRSVEDLEAGRPPNTLGAMQIVVSPVRRGAGFAGTMIEAMRASARTAGYRALIACVRPTAKELYPLTPLDRYAEWTRPDGLSFDPWIRLHVRHGGRIVRPSPRSMTIRGSVADWTAWTGLAFPDSGDYVVPGATGPITIDRERDEGVYFDQNVWIVHDLA